MNSNVSVPVSTGDKSSIGGESYASDSLLNILRLPHTYLIKISIFFTLYLLPFLISINRFSLKNFIVLCPQLLSILHKNYLAHVLAVCVSEETLLYCSSMLSGNGTVVDEVPEADGSITGAGNESC
jgi:hypothetical protein